MKIFTFGLKVSGEEASEPVVVAICSLRARVQSLLLGTMNLWELNIWARSVMARKPAVLPADGVGYELQNRFMS